MAQESRYSKVFVKIWHSKDFRTLSEEGKMLFLYLLTSPHRNMGGFYYLPLPYICFDIGLDEKRVIKAFEELTDKDMALYDYNTQVVLIKKWFCYNPIENKNQAKGLNKQLAEIPKSKLFKPFVNCVKEHCKYIETILNGFDIPSENPSETLSKPFAKPGTGTGTGTGTGEEDSPNPPGPDALQAPQEEHEENEPIESSDNSKKEPKYTECDPPYRAAVYLRNRILENNARARVPTEDPEDKLMQKWAQEMDRLHRIGPPGGSQGYSWKEIREIIDFCQDDDFWRANILSAAKLREKCVQLENQMRRVGSQPRGHPTMSSNVANALRLVEKYAQEEGDYP
jgi:hypothetical protein